MSGVDLSDRVAGEVRRRRMAAGMTRPKLAELCTALGVSMSEAMLANIETGRRRPDGTRQRDVSVDELNVLALALKVDPMDLLGLPGEVREPAVDVGWAGEAPGWWLAEVELRIRFPQSPVAGGNQVGLRLRELVGSGYAPVAEGDDLGEVLESAVGRILAYLLAGAR